MGSHKNQSKLTHRCYGKTGGPVLVPRESEDVQADQAHAPFRNTNLCLLILVKMVLSFAHGRRPDHLSSLWLVSKGLLSVEEPLQRPHLQALLRWCTTGGPLSSGRDSRALPFSLSSSAMAAGSVRELPFGTLNPSLVHCQKWIKNLQESKWTQMVLLSLRRSGGRQDLFSESRHVYPRFFRKYHVIPKEYFEKYLKYFTKKS